MLGILDIGLGNPAAIFNVCRHARIDVKGIQTPADLTACDRIILPGVGAFDTGMEMLIARGLEKALKEYVAQGGWILGICLGFQLLTNGSEEGVLPGLGLLPAYTKRLTPSPGLRIPHMGWSDVVMKGEGGGLISEGQRFYFVHSYHVDCASSSHVIGLVTHGVEIVAAARSGRVLGVQFHPEKSRDYGMRLIRCFNELDRCIDHA